MSSTYVMRDRSSAQGLSNRDVSGYGNAAGVAHQNEGIRTELMDKTGAELDVSRAR